MSQETSIRKAPSRGGQGAVVEAQHSASEEIALCSAASGGHQHLGHPCIVQLVHQGKKLRGWLAIKAHR